MFERLNQIEAKYDELTKALSSPEIDRRFVALPEDRQGP